MMMMIAFITFNSSWVPLIDGLCISIPWEFDVTKGATAWLFHVVASKNYCVLIHGGADGLWNNKASVLFDTQT